MGQNYGAVVDCVGGKTLAKALSETAYGGVATCCGLTGGGDLPTTVFPFILRGIRLIGIDSTASVDLQKRAWELISQTLKPEFLDKLTGETVALGDLDAVAKGILAGK